MKRDALENIVRNAMTDVEVALNTDEIWRGVEQKLYPQKKKRFGWFLLGLVSVAVLSAALLFPISQPQNPVLADNVTSVEKKTSTMSLNSDSASEEGAESQYSSDIQENIGTNSTIQNEELDLNNNQSVNSRSTEVNSALLNSKLKSDLQIIDANDINSKDVSESSASNFTVLSDDEKQKNVEIFENENIINESTLALSNNERTAVLALSQLSGLTPFLSSNTISIFNISLPILNKYEEEEPLTKNKPFASALAWHMDISMGIDKPFRSLSGSNVDYISVRNNTEKVLEGWHAQFMTGVMHKSGFYGDFGLSISNITEEVSVDSKRRFSGIGEVVTIDKDKSGQLSIGSTTGKYNSIETKLGTGYSRHTFYSVPLAIGYQLPFNKWLISGEIGTELNILKQSKGHQLNKDNELVSFNTIEGNKGIFLNRVGLNWNVRLKLGYAVRDQQYLYLSPYAILGNQSITQSAYPLEQYYKRIGVSMGYIYAF